jgi:hypothetical protein
MPKAKKKPREKVVREHVEHALKTHAENTWRDMGKADRYEKEKVALGLAFFELKLRMPVPRKKVLREAEERSHKTLKEKVGKEYNLEWAVTMFFINAATAKITAITKDVEELGRRGRRAVRKQPNDGASEAEAINVDEEDNEY